MFDPPLDPGIAQAVVTLCNGGIETFESCEGGEGHAYPEPTVRFHGGMGEGFRALGLSWIPSKGNFIAVDFGRDAAPINQAMLAEGVILRPVAGYGMPTFLRVSIGLPEENARCLEALAKVLGRG